MIYTVKDIREMIKDLPDETEVGIDWFGDAPKRLEASIMLSEISVDRREDATDLMIYVKADFWDEDEDDIDDDRERMNNELDSDYDPNMGIDEDEHSDASNRD